MHFFQGVSIVRIGGQDDNCRGSVWIIFHTQIYARITERKINQDMDVLSKKLDPQTGVYNLHSRINT